MSPSDKAHAVQIVETYLFFYKATLSYGVSDPVRAATDLTSLFFEIEQPSQPLVEKSETAEK